MKNSKFLILLASLVLCVSVLFMGVVAARNTSLTGGGTVTFVADGIYANVSGSIEGAKEGTITLDQFEINSEIGEGFQSDWLQESLNFNSSADEIEMKITIENLATDRTIWAKITDQNANVENLVKLIEPERVLEIPASTTKTFNIVFMVVNNNLSTTSSYDYRIDISRDDLTLTQEETGLIFADEGNSQVDFAGLADTSDVNPKAISIPSYVKINNSKYEVSGIQGSACYGRSDIIAVSMGDNVGGVIWSQAFYECDNLQKIGISKQIQGIGDSVFFGCKSLKNIIIPDRVSWIGSDVFAKCVSLTTINIPANLSSIASSSFGGINIDSYDSKLMSITVDPENQYYYVENNCLIQKREGGDVIISSCKNSQFPTSQDITEVATEAFCYLSDAYGLYNTTIPSNIKTLNSYSFYNVKGLDNITFAEGIETIPFACVDSCDDLTSVFLPSTLTTLSNDSFSECPNICYFQVTAGEKYYSENGCLMEKTTEGNVLVKAAMNMMMPGNFYKIGERAFKEIKEFRNMSTIVIPEGVTTIEAEAFQNCTGFNEIVLPSTLTTVGVNALMFGVNNGDMIVKVDSETIANSLTEQYAAGCLLEHTPYLYIKTSINLSESAQNYIRGYMTGAEPTTVGDYTVYHR